MTPQEATNAIKGSFAKCRGDAEFNVVMHCICEFMLISDFSVDEMIVAIKDADGDCAQSDKCIDEMLAAIEENYK